MFMLRRETVSLNCAGSRGQNNVGSSISQLFATARMVILGPVEPWRLQQGTVKIIEGPGCGPPAEVRFSSMPRYFFNTRIGDELISDPDGEVLRDPDRAWEMARAMIRELFKTDGADGALLSATIEVTDDDGEIVLEFPFAEAILDAPGGPITRH
jgi:hypothetical protein